MSWIRRSPGGRIYLAQTFRALWRAVSWRRCPACRQRSRRLETMCYLCAHGGDECLQMVREDLEAYGVDMSATPPMMYNDALRYLVSKLGLKAGFTDTREIAAYVRGSVPGDTQKP